jgi:CopG family nickel-responsive transcriptional regulator
MAVVSISLPDTLLESADKLMGKRGFSGRSEFIRACVREFLVAHAGGDVAGKRSATLTLVYPEGSERSFSRLRHTFGDVIRTMVHAHGSDACIEVFVLEGRGERIRAFGDALRGNRDAWQVNLTFTDLRQERSPADPAPAHRH